MSQARDDIFSNIRRSLGVTGKESPRQRVVAERLSQTPKGVSVARGQGDLAQRLQCFQIEAESSFATLALLQHAEEIPQAVETFLKDNQLPLTVKFGAVPLLNSLSFEGTELQVSRGSSQGADLNGLSFAFAGVAETGTLALVSGADNPSTLNFLPDNHIVVINSRDIEADYEAVFLRLRQTFGTGQMPRTLNFITGPSRSADIEQTLLLGAHGPRKLHILILL